MGSAWGNRDEGVRSALPLVLGLGEMASVGALRSPLPGGGGFPGGASGIPGLRREGSETSLSPPARVDAGPEAAGSCRGPPPARKKPAAAGTESPAPVLIWAAGSGSRAGPASLLPNLVLEVSRMLWREGSARESAGRSLPLKGPRHEWTELSERVCIFFFFGGTGNRFFWSISA